MLRFVRKCVALHKQCEESVAKSNIEKRGIIDKITVFEDCKFEIGDINILSNNRWGNDGAVALSTGAVGFVAAFCTAIQLSIV